MGQHNNTEDDFRQKLNQREITPSAAAWDRLDAMLTVAEGKKKKRSFGWLYIAASVLGFTLITAAYFSQTGEMIDAGNDRVVLENQPKDEIKAETPAEAVVINKKEATAAVAVTKQTISPLIKKSSIAPEVQPEYQPQIAQQTIINQKNEQEIKTKTSYVDVDELLASVEKEGKTKLTFPGKEKVKVNPGTLLSQVDGELDLSFREKALRSISRQYEKINVALSNRNNE